jgi:hypothetical protein
MLKSDVELRHAARATTAAPSYFQEIVIQDRSFVDGGFGETNNPSWESRSHYRKNHEGAMQPQLVMINIGTGTLPKDVNKHKLQKRPWWTWILPKALITASGLLADLAKMATDSEKPAERLKDFAEEYPEDLSFKRFSADTGIHAIKLDDWRAASDNNGIDQLTQAYLIDTAVVDELKQAARELTEVYVRRHSHWDDPPRTIVDVRGSVDPIHPDIEENHQVVSAPIPHRQFLGLEAFVEAVPSLVTGTEPTQSSGSSPPRTPEPEPPATLPISTANAKEILQGQGEQFGQATALSLSSQGPMSPS